MKNAFEVKDPDFKLSPHTGMTKKHYVELAKYLLERAFKHVKSVDSPLTFPIVPGKTYPQPGAPAGRQAAAPASLPSPAQPTSLEHVAVD